MTETEMKQASLEDLRAYVSDIGQEIDKTRALVDALVEEQGRVMMAICRREWRESKKTAKVEDATPLAMM